MQRNCRGWRGILFEISQICKLFALTLHELNTKCVVKFTLLHTKYTINDREIADEKEWVILGDWRQVNDYKQYLCLQLPKITWQNIQLTKRHSTLQSRSRCVILSLF